MEEQQGEYRQIMKATSIFGGVRVFNIIIAIIRSKFVAVLLGPTGMGIASLLNSTTALILEMTHFGLGTSAVKDVAAANASGDHGRIAKVVTAFRRLVWITGLLGTGSVLVLSPWLSRFAFGNNKYTLAFVWLSMTLLFSQLSSGQSVILQGMRKLEYLAKANIIGAVAGLSISVPIYYLWRIDGIVPAIILSSITGLCISWFYARKIPTKKTEINIRETFAEGKEHAADGFYNKPGRTDDNGRFLCFKSFYQSAGRHRRCGIVQCRIFYYFYLCRYGFYGHEHRLLSTVIRRGP